ncbi:MAG: hypothetical protein VX278_07950 [Myxococcota bacterium]|nr:hypothetical protein [Myxococcota bacterium]
MPLLSKTYIKSRLYQLEQKEKELLLESFLSSETAIQKKDKNRWMRLKRESNQRESKNIKLERRFLLRLMANIEKYPFLQESLFQKERDNFRFERTSLSEEEQERRIELLERERSLFLLEKDLVLFFGLPNSQMREKIFDRYRDIDVESIKTRDYFFEYEVLSSIFDISIYKQCFEYIKKDVINTEISVYKKYVSENNCLNQNVVYSVESSRIEAIFEGSESLRKEVLIYTEHCSDIRNIEAKKLEEKKKNSEDKLNEAREKLERENENTAKLIRNDIVYLSQIFNDLQNDKYHLEGRINTIQEQNEKLFKDASYAVNLPPLAQERTQRIDETYYKMQSQILQMYKELYRIEGIANELSKNILIDNAKLTRIEGSTEKQRKLQQEKENLIAEIKRAKTEKLKSLRKSEDKIVHLMDTLKEERRLIRPFVSFKEDVSQDWGEYGFLASNHQIEEFQYEIKSFRLIIETFYRDLNSQGLLKSSLSLSNLRKVLQWGLILLFVFFAWRGISIGIDDNSKNWLAKMRNFLISQLSIETKNIDIHNFKDVLKDALNVLVLMVLFGIIDNLFLNILLFILLIKVFYGFLRDGFLLFLTLFDVSLEVGVKNKILDSLFILTGWWVLFNVLISISVGIFRADRLADFLSYTQGFVFAFILFSMLKTWEPMITNIVIQRGDDGLLLRWLSKIRRSLFGVRFRSIIGLMCLVQMFVGWLISLLIEGSGWIGSTLARTSLKNQEEERNVVSEILEKNCFEVFENNIGLEAEEQRMVESFLDWNKTKNRGMLAIVGDKKAGKDLLPQRLLQHTELPIIQLELTTRITDENEILHQICTLFGIEKTSSMDDVILYIRNELPSSIIFVKNAHLCMIRTVDGYASLKTLLQILLHTSQSHFWVCSFNLHSWKYLDGPAAPINMDVFREVVFVEPLNTIELSQWFKSLFSQLNRALNFSLLSSSKKSKRIISRTEMAYWRLLTDSSNGNAFIALRYMLTGMHEEKEHLNIFMFKAPDDTDLVELDDLSLFVLTSLMIHDGLTLTNIQRSLNYNLEEIRSRCRLLRSFGMVEKMDEMFHIEIRYRPIIENFLIERKLMYME